MAGQQADPRMLNMAVRQQILARAIEMRQNIYSQTIATPGTTNNVINIAPRNVGLIKGFFIEIVATINNSGGNPITPSNFGPANILSQIYFTDLQNNVRINTSGWHMNFLSTARGGRTFGCSYSSDSPIMSGAINTSVITQTASIAPAGNGTVNMQYYVPLAYSDDDLRGALYANVVNATMNLQLTINPAPVVASNVDHMNAIYTGTAAAGSISSITINVYQIYLDQLPYGKNGVLLPVLDLSTIYEVKNTTLTGVVASQDFPISYANFRDFLSTFAVYNQNGTLAAGTDINYLALQSANFTNIIKADPIQYALWTRQMVGNDYPAGVYYLDTRRKPISTIQYGNMQMVLNAKTAAAGSYVAMGYEDFAMVNTVTGAGSLAVAS